MVEIPDLAHSRFDFVSFQLQFSAEDLENGLSADDYVEATGWELEGWRFQSESQTVVRLNTMCDGDDDQGVKLELTLEKFADPEADGIVRIDTAMDEIASVLTTFSNIPAQVRLDAGYSVAREELPPRGIVASMLGLTTAVSGEELLVTGANFAMRGFPGDLVTWYVARAGNVRGTISSCLTGEIRENTLTDLLFVADTRLHRFILEQPTRSTHAISNS